MPTDAATDNGAYSMGLEFYVTETAASCTAIHFWQPTGNSPSSATRTGALWRVDSGSTGTNLTGEVSFSTTVSGWNTLTFGSPVSLVANQRYRAVVVHPAGRYSA